MLMRRMMLIFCLVGFVSPQSHDQTSLNLELALANDSLRLSLINQSEEGQFIVYPESPTEWEAIEFRLVYNTIDTVLVDLPKRHSKNFNPRQTEVYQLSPNEGADVSIALSQLINSGIEISTGLQIQAVYVSAYRSHPGNSPLSLLNQFDIFSNTIIIP